MPELWLLDPFLENPKYEQPQGYMKEKQLQENPCSNKQKALEALGLAAVGDPPHTCWP